MDIILLNAKNFSRRYFEGGISKYKDLIDSAKDIVNDIDNALDKIRFLNFILERNNSDYSAHKLVCQDPEHCSQNVAHENITYYLTQELNRLGVQFNEDTFSEEEKCKADSTLEQILKDVQEIKLGQEIIYEDLTKEINELKDLYFLGKKKWYQLLIGKSVEMAAGGIVSETISKQILEGLKNAWPILIGNAT